MHKQGTSDTLIADLRAVVEHAEALLKATSVQTGEKIQSLRAGPDPQRNNVVGTTLFGVNHLLMQHRTALWQVSVIVPSAWPGW
jgi:hypothetical protein